MKVMKDPAALAAKVLTLDQLLPVVAAAKAQGQRIVTNNGSYDILHLGHLYGFYFSKQQGDRLIVGVNSDASIRAYKSPHRPINDEIMRVRMVAALDCVDYAFLFEETTPLSWLQQLQPHVHTNGAEYGEGCVERDVVVAGGGEVRLIPMIPGYSTTTIIQKIRSLPQVEHS